MIVSYIIGVLETDPKNLAKRQEKLKTNGISETILTDSIKITKCMMDY